MDEAAPSIEVTYYTDPLCCWSWAMEPHWRRLCREFGAQLTWRYRMGGLLADWQSYEDPLNSVSRPAQMGPLWYQASSASGVPIDARIWEDDPPATSYPACVAVKAAERQGAEMGEVYLRRLREAVMRERRNPARRAVLLELADEVADMSSATTPLSVDRFRDDLDSPGVLESFRDDLKDTRYRGIGRFPTLIFRPAVGRNVAVVGYRTYQMLRDALLWTVAAETRKD